MNSFSITSITRKNVLEMLPYSCARDEYEGDAAVFLDANENPFNTAYNRYPDPHQKDLKKLIAKIKGTPVETIFLGNGSDEAIDLPFRAFCEPGIHNAVSIHPSYGMYEVAANTNGVEFRKVLLDENYLIDMPSMKKSIDENTRLIFFCSPNNPSGNDLNIKDILSLCSEVNGLVIVDEAYIDFSDRESLIQEIRNYPNLLILQTFSKAYGLAGLRIGMAFGQKEVIDILNKIKYPYNVNVLSQEVAIERLHHTNKKNEEVKLILSERAKLIQFFQDQPYVKKVFPTQANFILVKFEDGDAIYRYLIEQSIITRNRSKVKLCESAVRITVGTQEENVQLMQKLQNFKK